MKVLDWILGKEPVATATGIAAVVTAALGVAAAFGLAITETQIAAIGALAAALAGWAARSAVTPLPRIRPIGDENGQVGLVLVGIMVILVLALVGLFAVCTPGEDDHSLGRLELVHHQSDGDPCWDHGDCDEGGYDGRGGDGGYSGGHQGYGGGGGRSGDYDGGPGDDCRTACNNTIIIPGPGGNRGSSRLLGERSHRE